MRQHYRFGQLGSVGSLISIEQEWVPELYEIMDLNIECVQLHAND
jgi:hypothetical protein